MINLQLQKVVYKKINSFFEINKSIELQVQSTFSLNIEYDDSNKACFATLKNETFAPEHPDIFNIDIEIIGIFKCDGITDDEDKKIAHTEIYNYLFPYVQLMISDLSIKAGLPPLMVERANQMPDEVTYTE